MPLQIEELLVPVSDETPGGVEVRYDPDFNQIRQARVEEDDLPTGGWDRERKTADHALVIKLSREILVKRSKDLQVAVWLTEALLKKEGFGGLRDGLDLIHCLLGDFWEHLHPELEDGDGEMRAAPLDWLGRYLDRAVRLVPINRTGHDIAAYRDAKKLGYEEEATTYEARGLREAAIAEGRLTAEDFDAAFADTPKSWYKQLLTDVDASLASVGALEAISNEKFGSDAPSYTNLRNAIQEVRQVAVELLDRKLTREPDPIEESVPMETVGAAEISGGGSDTAGTEGVVHANLATPGAVAAAATAAQVPRGRAAAEASIAAAARALRKDAPTDPGPYLMLRGLRWGELRAGGGDGIDPQLLAAPPTEARTALKSYLLEEKWAELLEASEEVMATPFGRGWLDLQRYAIAACDALAGDYAIVGAAIRSALAALLRDHPELPSLTLADDAPAANAETRAWLRSEGMIAESAAASEEEFVPPPRRSRIDVLDRARELEGAGKRSAAVELLMHAAEEERSARGRFLRRTQAAGILVDAGLERVAMPILFELSEQIQQHSLESWEEAETVARTLGLLYRCTIATEGQGSTSYELYSRICRLDPMQAMHFPTNE